MMDIIIGPYVGWGLGTLCCSYACSLLPKSLQEAMGIVLYAMFLALIIPEMKRQKNVLIIVLITIAISIGFWYLPFMSFLSEGWKVIITTVIESLVGAILFPREEGVSNE